MKKVEIKYNPYLVETTIKIDGMLPKGDSALNRGAIRLQDWVDDLPANLLKECRDANFEVTFTGSTMDFEDIKAAFELRDDVNATFKHIPTPPVSEVESTIDNIFNEIQAGPVAELKDKSIVDAFKKAKDSKFEVNVVATMSSGKSTLINALLGKQLMPAANEATTATIVKIVDSDNENFMAKAYDKSGNLARTIESVTLEDMKSLNKDERISTVELCGKIPFVNSVGMKLVLVDTPGPNNSRDSRHKEMTYGMLENSDKTLVLYVMNGTQLGINDEKLFLDDVSRVMKEGGKQSRERFIFAMNKMDSFKPKEEGTDCIDRAIRDAIEGLEQRGIMNPNIFPVSSLAALEKRTEDDEPMAIDTFRRSIQKYDCLHFDNYYQYSHQSLVTRHKIEQWIQESKGDDLLEIHTGIFNIEQAISQYVNKYAKTTKIRDLVQSFNDKLQELAAVARIENEIRNNKQKKADLERQIEKIKSNIKSAQNAQSVSKKIDSLDPTSGVKSSVEMYLSSVQKQVNAMLKGESKVRKTEAINMCKAIEKDCNELSVQIRVRLDQILQDTYKKTLSSVLDEYKKHLKDLNLGVDIALNLNPVDFVAAKLSDISSLVNRNTTTKDEGHYTKEEYTEVVEGGFWRKAASFLTFGLVDDCTYETRYRDKWVSNMVEYVDMKEVSAEYLQPIDASIVKLKKQAIDYVQSETIRLKEYLKKELSQLDNVLNQKLDALKNTEADTKATELEIKKKEDELNWLESIQSRVNAIIKF